MTKPQPNEAGPTYLGAASKQLAAICRAMGATGWLDEYQALQRSLMQGWGEMEVPAEPLYSSSIGDDHSPYEFSLAFSERTVEIRMLFETQAAVPGLAANRQAALLFNERLAERFGLDLTRFNAVRDLFFPDQPAPPFSLWHAVCFRGGRPPEFKLYMNPQACGAANAPALIATALERLGFARSTNALLAKGGRRGPELDELKYFSLDLSNEPTARVKVYFVHRDVGAAELEDAFSYAPTHVEGDVREHCLSFAAKEGPFLDKPLSSCFSFVAGQELPSSVTLHLPVAHYAANDAIIAERVAQALTKRGLPAQPFLDVVAALATRRLDAGAGIQSYASYRREGPSTRLTIYLSPELFQRRAIRTTSQTHVRRTRAT